MINFKFLSSKLLWLILFLTAASFTLTLSILFTAINYSDDKINNNKYSVSETPTHFQKQLKTRAAIPYWDQKNAFDSFRSNVDRLDYISLFWYYLSKNGQIAKYKYAVEDKSIIEFAHNNNVQVSAVITNLPEYEGGTWDSRLVENVLKNQTAQSEHIEDIKKLINRLGFDGVTIDYEEVKSSQRGNFSKFIEELSIALNSQGKYVEVALHPKTGEKTDKRYDFQDWPNLVKHADHLYIMAYGEHYDEGDAGPIAGNPWVKKIIRYSQDNHIPSEKLFLGIPLYGYDWNTSSDEAAKGLTYKDVESLISRYNLKIEWDKNYKSPHFHYGENHDVWFENAESVKEKIQLAKDANFNGITLWRLGGEDPQVWNILSSYR